MSETPNNPVPSENHEADKSQQTGVEREASTGSEVEEPARERFVELGRIDTTNAQRLWGYPHPCEGDVGGASSDYSGVPEGYRTHQGMSYQTPSPRQHSFPHSIAIAPHLQQSDSAWIMAHAPQGSPPYSGNPHGQAYPAYSPTSSSNPFFPSSSSSSPLTHNASLSGQSSPLLSSAPLVESPLLAWPRGAASHLSKPQKVKAIASFLRADLNMSPADFLLAIIESKDDCSELTSYKSGFYASTAIPRLLSAVSTSDKRGWEKLDKWYEGRSLEVVLNRVDGEMKALTSEFVVAMKNLQPDRLLNFNIEDEVSRVVTENSPWLQKILLRAAQSNRAMGENKRKTPIQPCTIIHAQLCNLRSSQSILLQSALAYNFFGLGVPKSIMDFLSKCGLTVCYSTVYNAHKELSQKMLQLARPVAEKPHVWTCDNIEVSTSSHVEQRDLGPAKVVSGTTIIIYPAPYASVDACQLKPIEDRRNQCDVISYEADIRPNRKSLRDMRSHLKRQIVEILLDNCAEFGNYKWRDSPLFEHKVHRAHPKGFKTQQSVLRTVPISEGSTDGCIEVITNSYIDQLKFGIDDLNNMAIPSINDQATNARIRGAQLLRKKDISALYRIALFQLGPGLFHKQLNMLWAILLVHRGQATDIGSLQYYITLLRLTRLNSDHPDFYTLKSFVRRVLFAHILQCWETESGFTSLADYAASQPCPDCLMELAGKILIKYASSPDDDSDTSSEGIDQIFENVKLLNRDLLYFFELDAAISAGDFGRVELFMGTYLEMFTGAGCKNYSTELLHFIQNLKKVWGPFADVMRDSMIVNISGRDGHSIGRDMNIEHANNIQKQHLFAKGMHAHFEALGDLAPCMPIHSALRRQFSDYIGASWQGTNHTTPNVDSHIVKIMAKMREEHLLIEKPGRATDSGFNAMDIQMRGQFILMDRGVRRFTEQYIALVKRGEAFEDEEDEIPDNALLTDTVPEEAESL